MIVFTATEFVNRLKQAGAAIEQCYCNSDFGGNLCDPVILEQYTLETAWDRTHAAETKQKAAAALAAGTPLWGWDCVNLIKGILWGWNGDRSKPRGNAVYLSNGVLDVTIEEMYTKYCTEQSTDFNNIAVGEMVVYSKTFGHCGVYIGGGYVIEATTKWDSKIQISRILNVSECTGQYPDAANKTRTWWAHGKLKFIDYGEEQNVIHCPCCGAALQINLTAVEQYRTYIVQQGNTLYGIARDLLGDGNRWGEIATLNNITDGNIELGQILRIPNK